MAHQGNVFRDGKVHVQAEMCSTCVFRPGNLMHLKSGRLRDIIESNAESALVCHQTLAIHPGGGEEAVCRGFYDRCKTTPLVLALAMDLIEWVSPS